MNCDEHGRLDRLSSVSFRTHRTDRSNKHLQSSYSPECITYTRSSCSTLKASADDMEVMPEVKSASPTFFPISFPVPPSPRYSHHRHLHFPSSGRREEYDDRASQSGPRLSQLTGASSASALITNGDDPDLDLIEDFNRRNYIRRRGGSACGVNINFSSISSNSPLHTRGTNHHQLGPKEPNVYLSVPTSRFGREINLRTQSCVSSQVNSPHSPAGSTSLWPDLTPSPQRVECTFYSDDEDISGSDFNVDIRISSNGSPSVRSGASLRSPISCSDRSPSTCSVLVDFPRSFAQNADGVRKPFILQRSLFPNVSPTLYFGIEEEEDGIIQLPKEMKPSLKWRLTSITPGLIRETVTRSGFKLVKEKTKCKKWIGTWCKHLKSVDFAVLNFSYNKVNHFPGSFHLGRKDKLWMNLRAKASQFGDSIFSDFHPMTYVLPQDLKGLRRSWINSASDEWKMILKPPASARGNGISVINKWSQIPKVARVKRRHPKPVLIAQQYLQKPLLLFNEAKFDLRVYVLVTSFNPLRIYIYQDGLVRFASEKYRYDGESLSDPFVHLTNYSINKTNEAYRSNNEPGSKTGHKWTLNTLWKYLNENNLPGANVENIRARINDMIIKTLISCEDQVDKLVKKHVKSRYTCFELLGFDIMLDSSFKPWLLEVNISPSLRAESELDASVKGPLIKDMLNLVGYRLPSSAIKSAASRYKSAKYQSITPVIDSQCFPTSSSSSAIFSDDKFFSVKLTLDERDKHERFESDRETGDADLDSILEDLTSDDVKILMETEDEFSRRGGFHRIFPGSGTERYLKYFDDRRYYNILLSIWGNKYDEDPSKGIELLQSLAKKRIHLKDRPDDSFLDDTNLSRGSPSVEPVDYSSDFEQMSAAASGAK